MYILVSVQLTAYGCGAGGFISTPMHLYFELQELQM
jgi:hypothetical protein